jgi:hypothetical protein
MTVNCVVVKSPFGSVARRVITDVPEAFALRSRETNPVVASMEIASNNELPAVTLVI